MNRFVNIVILFFAIVVLAGTADAATIISPDTMMSTIKFLSSEDLKGRGLGTRELDRAAEYIAQRFEEEGLMPGGDRNGWFQEWMEPELKVRMRNVVGVLPGKRPELAGQSVVIGAHYDHLGLGTFGALKENQGRIHPGADDNASGVAVLLELARVMARGFDPDRSVVFVAFTGEEAGKKGSQYYAANEKRYPVSKCVGMINLDTVGRLGKNKLVVLGAGSAQEWPAIFRDAGKAVGVEIADIAGELDSSDQKSFQDAGVPAVQLFSGPHLDYHRPTDTVDNIDSRGLEKIAVLTREVARQLASREGPLTRTIAPAGKPEPSLKQERKAGIGTIPDFAFKGKGVRLSGVAPGSPAEAAGLKEGDIIIRLNTSDIQGLKDFSDFLKSSKPGDRVTVLFLRDGKEMKVQVEVKER